jgi:hypothetical protein
VSPWGAGVHTYHKAEEACRSASRRQVVEFYVRAIQEGYFVV